MTTKKKVTVRLKNEVEYKGKMDNVDSYMNLIMTDAEELHEVNNTTEYKNTVRVCGVDIPSLMLDYAMKVER